MKDVSQWIMIAGVVGTLAGLTHHYKTALVAFSAFFVLAMLPPGQVMVDPVAVGTVVFYGAAALMGGYVLLQVWRWIGKAGW
jgi:hypothetical protein